MGHLHELMDAETSMPRAAASEGSVVTYWGDRPPPPPDGHERCTLDAVACSLAAIKGYAFAGCYDARIRYVGRLYFVPRETLIASAATRLPIRSEDDLFGGVVRYPFVATKTITHPLPDPEALSPEGWSARFPERVQVDVLSGYSAFSADDARRAGSRMLRTGPVRLKPASGIGGSGQRTAHDLSGLDAALNAMDPSNIRQHGLVVEQNLTEVTTYSVGVVNVAGIRIAYYGTQRLTPNHDGNQVYGGSDLVVVKGDFEKLLQLVPDPQVALAIRQAMRYDAAAREEFPGFFASRRNYDIAQGFDAKGYRRSGVLEQSWRSGGATPAELPALQAFRTDKSLCAVRASSVEVYGEGDPPPEATVVFRGVDPNVGALTKYSLIQPYGIVP